MLMRKILLTIAIIAISLIQVSAQCMLSPVLLPQRIQNSSDVIEGKVINQISFWDPAHTNIYTSNLIEVYKSFKNSSPVYLEIITEGGTVGNDKDEVHPSLELSIGDVGVFTLNSKNFPSQYGKPVYEAYASSQGFIRYNVSENEANEPFKKYLNLSTSLYSEIQQSTQTNYSVVKPINPFAISNTNTTQAVAAITGFSPSTITAGTFSVVTINGSGFGTTQGTSFVEFKRADDGGATFCRPDAWSYLLWSDTQIQVRLTTTGAGTVNSTPGSGVIRVDVGGIKTTTTASLTVTHAQMNVYSNGSAPTTIYNTRHVNKQSGGYVWQMYTGFDSNAAAKASFLRAFQSWRCGTYINWTNGATTAVNTIANDGVNVIRFDVGTELPAGVLGRCTSRFSGCGTQPNQNWFVNELDIVFDDGTTWNYGPAAPTFSQYDFESVAVHELGHGHQLGHVINSAEIMNYSIANGQSKRVLSVNDLAGGNAVMTRNLTGGVCAISAMTALTASNCTLGAPTASFTANRTTVCPGQTVVFTNLSTGSPTLNTWTFAGGTPSTSTLSSPTVTYNTPGSYSVQLVASNAFGSNTYSVTAYINVTSPATLPLSQTFQTATFPPTNWYVNDDGNDNIKWKLATNAGFGSTQSTVFDNWTDSITPYKDELKTYVNLAGFSTAKMTFYRSYSQTFAAPYVDTLQIGVSTNCGTSTVYPYLKGGSQLATATTSSSAAPFTPTATTQWVKDSIDLTPYVGQTNVMVAFINRGHYGDAIYLDNINITGVAATTPTAAITSANTGCTGVPITLTDASTGGPSSWLWTMTGGAPSTSTVQNTSVTYTTAGVKTITLTVANGSGTTTATKSITISATPTVAASITNTTICRGASVTINLTGATVYTWLPSGSGSSSVLSPTTTTIYTITGNTGSCNSAPRTVTVNVTPTPTTNISASSLSICAGQSTTLTASGATTYAWLPGAQTTTVIAVTPTITTTYTVTGTTTGCSSNKTITVNVSSTPTVAASITNTTICRGSSVTVNLTGATVYTWLPSGAGSSSVLSPTTTTIYTITGSNGSCNSAPRTVTINVTPTPTTNISASSLSICAGQSTTLTASGATTYAWLPGAQTTTVITVTPTITTTYTSTGTTAGCSSNRTITVNVSSTPTVAASVTSTTICRGASVTVNLTGASIYTWLPSGSGSSSVLSPTTTSTYTIIGSNGSCNSAPRTVTVNVTPSPTVNVTASPTLICTGQTATLTASGATTYAWLPGAQTTPAIAVTPTITTTYTVNGTTAGCSGNNVITLTVSTCTGIDNLSSPSSHLFVFPNPSNGLFTISNTINTDKLEVTIINTLGQTVMIETAKNTNQLSFDLSKMSKGIYYAKVTTNEGTQLFKLILE
jgi:PKD repeat protein